MLQHALLALCALSACFWAWSLYAVLRSRAAIPRLLDDRSPAPARWPRVSLIIAARDEERELAHAVRTRLADDYPNLQVVLVDDRSSDATPAIADALALEDARVKVVHLTSLPAGWLGKLYAMHRGVQEADGEWLLFSDADIEFAPGTLRKVLARCEHEGRDHAAVLPEFRPHGLAIDATMDLFMLVLLAAGRLWKVTDPRSSAAVGGGMFNLVRRSVYDRTPGLEWLKLEVGDDVALGQMLKRHGARPIVFNAVGAVKLDFYRSLGEMAYGMEKSAFAVMGRFRHSLLLFTCVASVAVTLGFVAGFAHHAPWVRALAAACWALAWASQTVVARWSKRAVLPALLFPLGIVAMVAMALRSGYLAWRRGGIAWRGTLYSTAELRAGSRIEVR